MTDMSYVQVIGCDVEINDNDYDDDDDNDNVDGGWLT